MIPTESHTFVVMQRTYPGAIIVNKINKNCQDNQKLTCLSNVSSPTTMSMHRFV